MRIVIETDERMGASAAETGAAFDRSQASDAGPPDAALLAAVSEAAAARGDDGASRDGEDGGAPAAELLERVQGVETTSRAAPGFYVVDGGAAPRD